MHDGFFFIRRSFFLRLSLYFTSQFDSDSRPKTESNDNNLTPNHSSMSSFHIWICYACIHGYSNLNDEDTKNGVLCIGFCFFFPSSLYKDKALRRRKVHGNAERWIAHAPFRRLRRRLRTHRWHWSSSAVQFTSTCTKFGIIHWSDTCDLLNGEPFESSLSNC